MATTALPSTARLRNLEQILKDNIDRLTNRRLRHLEVRQVGNQLTIRADAPSFYVKQLALTSVLPNHRREGIPENRVRHSGDRGLSSHLDE